MKKITFISNGYAVFIGVSAKKLINLELTEIFMSNNTFHGNAGTHIDLVSPDIVVSIMSSNFESNYGNNVRCSINGHKTASVTNNTIGTTLVFLDLSSQIVPKITSYKVQFNNNMGKNFGIVSINAAINMHMVNFTQCNTQYTGYDDESVIYILFGEAFKCAYIKMQYTNFDQNKRDNSVVHIATKQIGSTRNRIKLLVNTSTFTNNIGSPMYLSTCDVKLSGNLLFKNNTAENGGALYLNQGTTVTIDDKATVQFIGNTAILNGGAIYVDLLCDNFKKDTDTFLHHGDLTNLSALFIKNSAMVAGNSLYFSVQRFCSVNTNINNSGTLLYVPCHFNYSQPVNGKMMDISCDLDYTLLNGTGAPIVTSPHELRLYFPFNDGYNISSTSDHNVYFIRNNILGHPVKFTGAVFDYFGKPAEPTLFSIQLKYSSYILIGGNDDNILTQSINNFTILNINFKGKKFDINHINLTLTLRSLSYLFIKINTTFMAEIIPCTDHPGYIYNGHSQTCVCYHANVKCNTNGNEVKRSHWFGNIGSKATTSLCPNHYCKFTNRKHASKGYFALPNTINAQCNHHRVGRACGECSSGYTLSYDSTDCISVDQCGTGWTVLVIMMTCLYWITVVVGVFSLMYFIFQISLGYLYMD